jgi:hypothetical protein
VRLWFGTRKGTRSFIQEHSGTEGNLMKVDVFATAFSTRLWDTGEPLLNLLGYAQPRSLPVGEEDEAVLPAFWQVLFAQNCPMQEFPTHSGLPRSRLISVMLALSSPHTPHVKRPIYDLIRSSRAIMPTRNRQSFSTCRLNYSFLFHGIETLTGLGILSPSDN